MSRFNFGRWNAEAAVVLANVLAKIESWEGTVGLETKLKTRMNEQKIRNDSLEIRAGKGGESKWWQQGEYCSSHKFPCLGGGIRGA